MYPFRLLVTLTPPKIHSCGHYPLTMGRMAYIKRTAEHDTVYSFVSTIGCRPFWSARESILVYLRMSLWRWYQHPQGGRIEGAVYEVISLAIQPRCSTP